MVQLSILNARKVSTMLVAVCAHLIVHLKQLTLEFLARRRLTAEESVSLKVNALKKIGMTSSQLMCSKSVSIKLKTLL